jgi:hypothetical protein
MKSSGYTPETGLPIGFPTGSTLKISGGRELLQSIG